MEQIREDRACAVGTDQIVRAWEAMNDGFPFFAIFHTKAGDKFLQYNKDNYAGAKEYLTNNLAALEDNEDTAMYYLKIYPVAMAVYPYRNGGEIAGIPMRLNKPVGNSSASGTSYTGGNDSLVKMLNDHQVQQIEMVKEIAELKAAQAPMSLFDQISGVLDSPAASQTIVPLLLPVVNGLMGIIHKISGILPQQTAMTAQYQNPVIAGPGANQVDLDQKLDIALDRLQKHGDLVEMLTLLADFADKSPTQFSMYLQMLKGG